MDDIAKTIADMMRDPKKVAVISKNLVDLGALFERAAETFQALAREVEKMGEAAAETTAEPERPTYKVGQRVRIARDCNGIAPWIHGMERFIGGIGVVTIVEPLMWEGVEVAGRLAIEVKDQCGRFLFYPPEALDLIDG